MNHVDDRPRPMMSKPGRRGLRRLVAACRFSFRGYRAAWRMEEAFRTEVLMALVLFPAALWLGQSTATRLLLIMSWVIVIFAELMNTAIESVVDRVGHEKHPLSGQAKDLGSALVFTGNVLALVVWVMIAWERFFG